MKLKIQTGDVFGNLTVIRELDQIKNTRYFLFSCICGKEKKVSLGQAKGCFIKSCGCMKVNPRLTITHGDSKTRLYAVWQGMKSRCFNPKRKSYVNYGGRGITVCDEWLTYEPFKKWALSNGYSENLTIERKDVQCNYSPENCSFIPKSDQSKNRRGNVMLTYEGKTQCVSEWAKELDVPRERIINRIKNLKWAVDKALSIDKNPPKRRVNYES